MTRPKLPYLDAAEREHVHEQVARVLENVRIGGHLLARRSTREAPPLPDDLVREVDGVIERYTRSAGAPRERVDWRDAI